MGWAIASRPPEQSSRARERADRRWWYVSITVAVALLTLSWQFERLAWVLCCALFGFVIWQWSAIRRLQHWQAKDLGRPPELAPPWDELANRQYRRTRRSRQQRRTLLHSLRRLAQFAQAVPDALVVLDANDRIEWRSPLADDYLGIKRVDVGKSVTALLRHPDLVAIIETRAGESFTEVTLPFSDRTLEIRVTPLFDQRRLITARDTTQIQRLLTMRQDFVANVSHELRTPLTVISGYLEQAVDADLDEATLRDVVKRLVSPTNRMKNLVDDLLLLTRLESSSVPPLAQLDPVDVAALLNSMVREARDIGRNQHHFIVEADTNLRLLGIERELYSAFINLLVNAVRYSPDGGDIVVSWRRTDHGARFEVRDHGVGISNEHLARITERFYRVDVARSRAAGGTGLGLAIVKHVLRRHDAELTVVSTPGSGSTFSCEFSCTRIWRPDANGLAQPQWASNEEPAK